MTSWGWGTKRVAKAHNKTTHTSTPSCQSKYNQNSNVSVETHTQIIRKPYEQHFNRNQKNT